MEMRISRKWRIIGHLVLDLTVVLVMLLMLLDLSYKSGEEPGNFVAKIVGIPICIAFIFVFASTGLVVTRAFWKVRAHWKFVLSGVLSISYDNAALLHD